MEYKSVGSVPFTKVKRALEDIEKQSAGKKLEHVQISFEYLVGSFFPEIIDNIRQQISQSYIEGYNDGKKEG